MTENQKKKIIDFSPGAIVDNRYEVICLLGMGAIGKVYKVKHTVLNTVFAVKFVLPDDSSDVAIKRFRQEAQAVSLLKHPNIVGIHDFGVADDLPYLVMEYLEGRTLAEELRENGCLSSARFYNIFEQVCAALNHAHEQGVLHRDIKPANIFISTREDEPDKVTIMDFGLAKLLPGAQTEISRITLTGEVVGSPFYMSPEQCTGDELDSRSDIYSLGIVMYEVLTGAPMFIGKNPVEIMQQHLKSVPKFVEDSGVLPKLQEVVLKCLKKDPKSRYQRASDLRSELTGLKESEQKAALQYGSAVDARAKNFLSRRKILLLLVCIAAAALTFFALKFMPKPGLGSSQVQGAGI